jgi:hypothetical protein
MTTPTSAGISFGMPTTLKPNAPCLGEAVASGSVQYGSSLGADGGFQPFGSASSGRMASLMVSASRLLPAKGVLGQCLSRLSIWTDEVLALPLFFVVLLTCFIRQIDNVPPQQYSLVPIKGIFFGLLAIFDLFLNITLVMGLTFCKG